MRKVNWTKLAARIPKKFKAGKNIFNVIWLDKFDDPKQVGMSDWNNKCIYLLKKQSKKELVHTYFHECLHIFSDEYNLKISEKQVGGLEKTLPYWLFYGNIFSKGRK